MVEVKNASEQTSSRFAKAGRGKRQLIKVVVAIVVVAIVALAAFFAVNKMNASAAKINTNQYQAVFLTNGQVYFGKLQNAHGEYLELKNIYYLQVDESIQSGTTEATTAAANNSNVQLIKLGNELHGPEDEMQVSTKQVLFWENLKGDSKVSQAIESYKKAN